MQELTQSTGPSPSGSLPRQGSLPTSWQSHDKGCLWLGATPGLRACLPAVQPLTVGSHDTGGPGAPTAADNPPAQVAGAGTSAKGSPWAPVWEGVDVGWGQRVAGCGTLQLMERWPAGPQESLPYPPRERLS